MPGRAQAEIGGPRGSAAAITRPGDVRAGRQAAARTACSGVGAGSTGAGVSSAPGNSAAMQSGQGTPL